MRDYSSKSCDRQYEFALDVDNLQPIIKYTLPNYNCNHRTTCPLNCRIFGKLIKTRFEKLDNWFWFANQVGIFGRNHL